MKLITLINNEKALYDLSKIELSNAQLAWDLADDIEKAGDHIKRFHDKRNALMQKVGEQSEEDPNKYILKKEHWGEFNAEVAKLENVNVKITFPAISIKELQGVKVSAANMAAWRELKIIIK